MARSKKFQGYSLSPEVIDVLEIIADNTGVPKSRLVEKALRSYYEKELKEVEDK